MKRATVWTITTVTGSEARGDCPVWAADFTGSATAQEGGTLTAQRVMVVGGESEPCHYCTGTGRPTAHPRVA